MKILMVNKFLFPKGGSETYCLTLGEYLSSQGHEIQYFGMEHKDRCVGNSANAYTMSIDFHEAGTLTKLVYSLKTIYSFEARRKIRLVLDSFHPDMVHLNNINFQLTPSIIYEIRRFGIPMVLTVHDSQIACPNHRMYIEHQACICEKCLEQATYIECVKNRCVHGSLLKSIVAAFEAFYYHKRNTYNLLDAYICPSKFIASVIERSGVKRELIHILSNPTDYAPFAETDKPLGSNNKYILYFGRLIKEKGIKTLLEVADSTPYINYIFAGAGPLKEDLIGRSNVKYVGFQTGDSLKSLIANAVCTVYPAEWYENCPLSVIESQVLGTPVLASDLGGTSELIEDGVTGRLFSAKNSGELKRHITDLWFDEKLYRDMNKACLDKKQLTMSEYSEALLNIYELAMQRQKKVSRFKQSTVKKMVINQDQ
jgi:glycosyltransferase involved in cell wall biosynthesis